MIKGRWLICLASEDWGGHPSSSQHLIKVLAKYNKVLWIDSIGMRRPQAQAKDIKRVKDKLGKFFQGLKKVNDNLYVYTPVVAPFHEFWLFRLFNRFFLTYKIRQFRKELNIANPIWWISTPIMATYIKGWEKEDSIYYMGDEYAAHYVSYAGLIMAAEKEILKKVRLTLVVSDALYQKSKGLTSNLLRVDHGVDVEHFAQAGSVDLKIPQDIANIPQPIIGYYGLIREWVDLELIKYLAEKKPQWSFVLLGESVVSVMELKALTNVFFLGAKPHAELPAYLKAFAVGLIPYKVNELTINANPLKMREYLAAGKPVVSPPLPAVEPYTEVIETASTPEEFLSKIEKCLTKSVQDDYKCRQQRVVSESWEAVAEKISQFWSSLIP